MAAYILASYDVVDPETYAGYPRAVGPLLRARGAEILVADYEARALEGEARSVYVVLQFESRRR